MRYSTAGAGMGSKPIHGRFNSFTHQPAEQGGDCPAEYIKKKRGSLLPDALNTNIAAHGHLAQ